MTHHAREPRHFAYIDAVRGLAFLGVLSVHCAATCGHFPFSDLAGQGGYGVQFFFLASAITLCNSMATRREGRFEVGNFYLRRLFRIAPLFWLGILVYWLVPGVLPPIWLTQWAPNGVHGSYFLLTALFLQGWHPYTFNSIVPGGWSIAVEMTFYLIFPFCFHYITTLQRAALCVLYGIAFTVLERALFRAYSPWLWPSVHNAGVMGFFSLCWFPSQFAVFLIGIFTYFVLKEPTVKNVYENPFWSRWLFTICLLFLVSLMHHTIGGFLPPLLIVMAMAGIIVALAGNSIPVVVNIFFCHLGTLSYSCYLTHFAALGIVVRILEVWMPQNSIRTPAGLEIFDTGSRLSNLGLFLAVSMTTLILTFIFSTVTHHLIENPGIKLGKKVIRHLDDRILLAGKNNAPTG